MTIDLLIFLIQFGSAIEDSLPAGSTCTEANIGDDREVNAVSALNLAEGSIDSVVMEESPKCGPTTQLIEISCAAEAQTDSNIVERENSFNTAGSLDAVEMQLGIS